MDGQETEWNPALNQLNTADRTICRGDKHERYSTAD